MEKGYLIETNIDKGINNIILVSNFTGLNLVANYLINKSNLFLFRDSNDIGMWKIKVKTQ